MPDDYTEPLFDDDYMMVNKSPQQYVNSGDIHHEHYSQLYAHPATSLHLLFTQIKETMVMEILPQSIWYVFY